MEAYKELNSSRAAAHEGVMPIPWPAINAYAIFHKFNEDQHDKIHYYFSAMDLEMNKWAKKRQQVSGSQPKPRRIRS